MSIRPTLTNTTIGTLLAVQQPSSGWNGPGMNLLNWFASAAVTIGLVICVIAVVGGAITLVIGRFAQHGVAQKAGAIAVILGLVAGAIIGSAALLVNTGYQQGL